MTSMRWPRAWSWPSTGPTSGRGGGRPPSPTPVPTSRGPAAWPASSRPTRRRASATPVRRPTAEDGRARSASSHLEEVAGAAGAGHPSQRRQRPALDDPDRLPGEAGGARHLLQRARIAAVEAEVEKDDRPLLVPEDVEQTADL